MIRSIKEILKREPKKAREPVAKKVREPITGCDFDSHQKIDFTQGEDDSLVSFVAHIRPRYVNAYPYLDFFAGDWIQYFFLEGSNPKRVGYQIFAPYKNDASRVKVFFFLLEFDKEDCVWLVSHISSPVKLGTKKVTREAFEFRSDLLGNRMIL